MTYQKSFVKQKKAHRRPKQGFQIKILTQNIDGHTRSLDSNQKLLRKFKPDLFLRQEDWLFSFQHFLLNQVDQNYMGMGKAIDCDDRRYFLYATGFNKKCIERNQSNIKQKNVHQLFSTKFPIWPRHT